MVLQQKVIYSLSNDAFGQALGVYERFLLSVCFRKLSSFWRAMTSGCILRDFRASLERIKTFSDVCIMRDIRRLDAAVNLISQKIRLLNVVYFHPYYLSYITSLNMNRDRFAK